MPEFVLPGEADRCPECNAVLYVGRDCQCGKCPAEPVVAIPGANRPMVGAGSGGRVYGGGACTPDNHANFKSLGKANCPVCGANF